MTQPCPPPQIFLQYLAFTIPLSMNETNEKIDPPVRGARVNSYRIAYISRA